VGGEDPCTGIATVTSMQDVYQFVVKTLAAKCKIEPSLITPSTDVFADLGVDSAEFFDVTFVIEDEFNIRMPVAEWMSDVNVGNAVQSEHFRIDNFVAAIVALMQQSQA
jgi:acyl carrier protein